MHPLVSWLENTVEASIIPTMKHIDNAIDLLNFLTVVSNRIILEQPAYYNFIQLRISPAIEQMHQATLIQQTRVETSLLEQSDWERKLNKMSIVEDVSTIKTKYPVDSSSIYVGPDSIKHVKC